MQFTIYLFQVLSLVQSFNIEAQNPTIITGDPESYFGYQVLQYGPENDRRLMITAPLEQHGNITGAIHKCDGESRICRQLRIPKPPQTHLEGVGLSLTANPSSPSELMMCVPSFSYSCATNTFVNGICYKFGDSLLPIDRFTPAFQPCPKSGLDVAFLIDGSGSISSSNFVLMKNFMKKVIKLFAGKDVLFSISQFSMEAKTEFDFSEYRQTSDWTRLIDRIPQMSSVTFTPTGIKHVSDNVFTPVSGARNWTNWVMIVITDGESNDQDITFPQAIEATNKKSILRYAIGVGDAFGNVKATRELETIASPPSKDFVFKASDFNALEGLQDRLKDKIFAIEGTSKTSGESSFQMELAQTGFSSIYSRDSITLGAVGAFDWAGAIVDIRGRQEKIVNTTVSRAMANAYLGYAMVEARRGGQRFCIVGAPRYKFVGRVVTFQDDNKGKNWELRQNIDGEQIGSYFGMTLCAVDVDGDSETELILIGAPLYHTATTGGKVSVCSLSPQGNVSCSRDLQGRGGNVLGRFGSAVATLGDLNGDGLREVAVGAPLEDGHRGSVYIYHGVKGGIADTYSQRIPSSQAGNKLKYFGTSIDGRFDLTKDGLIDLTVGAQGGAVILRSAPVLSVTMKMNFDPAMVPLASFECTSLGNNRNSSVNVHICFQLASPMAKQFRSLSAMLNYTLTVDVGRQKYRAEFANAQRSGSWVVRLSLGSNCLTHRLEIQNCIEDYYYPIELSTSYCAEGIPIASKKNLKPSFKETCSKVLRSELPFEKNCGSDGVCISDLQLDFNSTGFMVHSGAQFNLTVSLRNVREDSYDTNVEFWHPLGISFRKVTILKSDRKIPIVCDDTRTVKGSGLTHCSVSHPVYPEKTQVFFILTLDVSNSDDWQHLIEVNVTAISDNEEVATLENNEASLQIPVRFRVNLLLRSSESTPYINISLGSQKDKLVVHQFQVKNLSKRPLPVNVTFTAPKRLGHGIIWLVSGAVAVQAMTNGVQCADVGEVRGHVAGQLGGSKDCKAESCLVMHCVVDQLTQGKLLTFALRGYVSLNQTSKTKEETLDLQTVAKLSFDGDKYTQGGYSTLNTQFLYSNVTTHVEMIKVVNLLPIIAGGAAGGLLLLILVGIILWKAGFFNRKYKDRIGEGGAAESSVPLNASPVPSDPAAT